MLGLRLLCTEVITMALKVELVLTVYKQENEPKKKCRDKTPKGEKLPKLKNN